MVRHIVEDEIVALLAPSEVFLGIVDDMVSAEGAHQVHVLCGAHAGYVGAERLGDLHGERPDTA